METTWNSAVRKLLSASPTRCVTNSDTAMPTVASRMMLAYQRNSSSLNMANEPLVTRANSSMKLVAPRNINTVITYSL